MLRYQGFHFQCWYRGSSDKETFDEFVFSLHLKQITSHPVNITSFKTSNINPTSQAHPATAPGSEPTIMDSDNLGLTGSHPELEPTTRGSYPELEPTTRGSYPEVEQKSRCSYPEVEPTPVSCCFEFFSGRVPLKDIKGYRKSPPTCPVEAIVIFTTTTLCVDPDAAWVKRLLITLDENGKGVNPDDCKLLFVSL
ncbi:hypothetical protein ABVT39_026174 [Epinephelus coioides]